MTFQGVGVYMVKPLDTSAIFKEMWTWKLLEISEILPRRSKSVLPQKPKQVRSNPENPFARLEKHPSSCIFFNDYSWDFLQQTTLPETSPLLTIRTRKSLQGWTCYESDKMYCK